MMISDSETKGSGINGGDSHAFPLLKKNAMIDPAGSSEPGDCFKPLFNHPTTDENLSTDRSIGVSRPVEDRNSEDNARRKGFDRGFDAGKQEACSLVQAEMAPQIKSFVDAFSHWNASMVRTEELSNHQILKMAVAIAERILGTPPQSCSGKLESLEGEIKARMREAYQLEVMLNPGDMNALSGSMSCESVQWEQWDYITATGDADVQAGELVVAGTRTFSADDGILRSLDASLSEELAQGAAKNKV